MMAAPAPCNLLAFDTSTEVLALALGTAGHDDCENLPGGAAASATLLPAVRRLVQRAGLDLVDLDGVAFGRGPGAFTGLRTSCAAAQGLALGLGCPVLPVDSLLIVAEDARAGILPADTTAFDIGVAVDARMGEVYAARYRWRDGAWQRLETPMLCAPQELLHRWQDTPPDWLAGSGLPLLPAGGRLPGAARRIGNERHRAAALLALARAAWSRGEGVDAAQALPLYLRDKVALTTEERAAAAAAPVR